MGAGPCGKTSIAHYFYTGKYLGQETITTNGIDYHFKFASWKDKKIKLILWDISGQEKYISLAAGFLRGVQALLLVFSLTPIDYRVEKKYKEAEGEEKLKIQKEYTQETFKEVSFWLQQFKIFNTQEKKIIYLIGNKCDDSENRIINLKDAKQYAQKNNFKYFEISAKTGRNIQKVFWSLTLDLMKIYSPEARHSDKKKQKEKKSKGQYFKNYLNKFQNC